MGRKMKKQGARYLTKLTLLANIKMILLTMLVIEKIRLKTGGTGTWNIK